MIEHSERLAMPALNNRLTESKHHNCNDILSVSRTLTTNGRTYILPHILLLLLIRTQTNGYSGKLNQQTLASTNSTERKVNGK